MVAKRHGPSAPEHSARRGGRGATVALDLRGFLHRAAFAAQSDDGARLDLAARIEALEDEVWSLRDTSERRRSMLEASGDVILRADAARRVVYVDDAFASVFGAATDDLLGRSVEAVVAELAPAGPCPDETPAAGPPATRAADRLLRTRDGARWFSLVEIALAPRRGDDAALQVVLRDVTDRRAIESELRRARDLAEAAAAARSRFLALASHEIRTPLNGILGMADLLGDTPLTEEQAAYVRAVRTSGEALMSLVDDVLDHARIEAGRLDLLPEPTSIEAVVESVVELLAPRAQAKGIELAGDVAAAVPARLLIDAGRLRQVLVNLVGNAIKFTEMGGVAVVATLDDGGPRDQSRLRFVVRDTGIGIEPADAERIFDEFEQAESGPARRFGGTGLGLAISRAIVRRMGGDIGLDSRPGHGSVFSFDLDAPRVEAAPEAPAALPLAGRSLLLVSPAAIEPPLMVERLVALGASARLVGDGAAARTAIAAVPSDGLVVDHRPGFDAAAVLAALGPAAPPAIVLIAPSDRAAMPRLRAAGFVGYLVKPVRRRSLAEVAGALVEGRRIATDAADRRMPAEPQPAAARPLAVLVADDNAINALLAGALLQRLGHRVTTVADGARAVAAVGEARAAGRGFDAVLMDLHMPTLDGLAAIRAIRAAEAGSGGRPTLVVALTADQTPQTEDAALAAGADIRLVKPVDAAALAAVLAAHADASG